MGLGTQSGKLLFNNVDSTYGITISSDQFGITFSAASFTYSNILFVDRNGTNPPPTSYTYGHVTTTWEDMISSLNYITPDSRGNKTVLVFPGTYTFSSEFKYSKNLQIHLLPGVTLNVTRGNFLESDGGKISITSESKKDCKINISNGYFCAIRNSGEISISNTSIFISATDSSVTTIFGLTNSPVSPTSLPNFLSMKDCYLHLSTSKSVSIFNQVANSGVYLDNCSIYFNPSENQSSTLFLLNNSLNEDPSLQLGIRNSRFYMNDVHSMGISYIRSVPSDNRPTNFVMIQGCIFQSLNDTFGSIISSSGIDGMTFLYTSGNSIYSSTTFSNYNASLFDPNFSFSDIPVELGGASTYSTFTYSSVYQYTGLRSLPPPFEVWES